MRKIKIYLHGNLKNLVPEPIELQAETAAEAIQAMSHNYPQLQPPLDVGRWPVKIKDYDTKESLYVPLYTDELHIFPFFGFNKSVWAGIGLGVALIITGGALGAALAAGSMGLSAGAATALSIGADFLMYSGMGLLSMGISKLLAPTPDMGTYEAQVESSKYLGAPKNTVEAGTRIPICYGLFKVYGHYISFDINAVDTINSTNKSKSFSNVITETSSYGEVPVVS